VHRRHLVLTPSDTQEGVKYPIDVIGRIISTLFRNTQPDDVTENTGCYDGLESRLDDETRNAYRILNRQLLKIGTFCRPSREETIMNTDHSRRNLENCEWLELAQNLVQ
jgi:hypothetical protein